MSKVCGFDINAYFEYETKDGKPIGTPNFQIDGDVIDISKGFSFEKCKFGELDAEVVSTLDGNSYYLIPLTKEVKGNKTVIGMAYINEENYV